MNALRQERLRVELPAVLSLGSNLGDREATIRGAIADIAHIDGVTVHKPSAPVTVPFDDVSVTITRSRS